MAVELPENPLFAPELEIRVFDKKLGGMSNPLIGSLSVRLDKKLPWNHDDYVPPLTMEVKKGKEMVQDQEEDEGATAEEEQEQEDEEDEKEGAGEGGAKEEKEGDKKDEAGEGEGKGKGSGKGRLEDTGVGVVGPLEALDLGRVKEDVEYEEASMKALAEARASKKGGKGASGFSLLDIASEAMSKVGDKATADMLIDFPQTWASSDFLVGRDWLLKDQKYKAKELEEVLETAPFEIYELYRGATRGKVSILGDASLRSVGILKGIIRVCTSDPRYEATKFFDIKSISRTVPCIVRLYVVKADHLQPKDLNGLADPFLAVKFGTNKIVDRENRQEGTLEPEFYSFYEFQTTFPGPSQLKVQIYDWNRFLNDQLIGETIIDLEDRWYHPKWQDMGHDHSRAKLVGR